MLASLGTLPGKAKRRNMSNQNTKLDFLKECMSDAGQMPLDEFNVTYCVRCANRECARSGSGQMSFDRRVQNWQKDMFINVPRAQENDPRYTMIRSKHFRSANSSTNAIVSLQGRNDAVTKVEEQVNPAPAVSAAPNTNPTATTPMNGPLVPQESPIQVNPTPSQASPSPKPQTYNTPFVQGVMLPGHEQKSEEKDETVEMDAGGTFTFGGGDE